MILHSLIFLFFRGRMHYSSPITWPCLPCQPGASQSHLGEAGTWQNSGYQTILGYDIKTKTSHRLLASLFGESRRWWRKTEQLGTYQSGGWSPRPAACCSRSRGPSRCGAGPPARRILPEPCNTAAWGVRRREAEQSDKARGEVWVTQTLRG